MSNNNKDYPVKNFREVSRVLTIVENGLSESNHILKSLSIPSNIPVIGITGPPGAGKSTLVNRLIEEFLKDNYRIAIIAVDPSSPFNFGSLLGDRIRMQNYATHPNIFIRSVASRGSLGGLSAKIIEMTDVLKSSGFDYILVETVGVGQSEIEIASLADITLLVLVPESGDEVQFIKAGIMEVGDGYILNKADRPGADQFLAKLQNITKTTGKPVFKTVASQNSGVSIIADFIKTFDKNKDRSALLAHKAWNLIQEKRMADLNKLEIMKEIREKLERREFNLYHFVQSKLRNS